MNKYLYGASAQGIQEFIFATNELKTIIGASEIIKNINNKIKEKYEKNIIINAAGNVKLIFDETQKDILDELVLNFPKEIKQSAFGITISQAVVKFESGELKQAFESLEKKLFIQRNKTEIPLDMSINIIKFASKSGKAAIQTDKDKATVQKETMAIEKNLTGNIPKNKKNKTAIIHADGNGLGAMIASMNKNLNTDNEIIKAYKEFSINLDEATNAAYENATKNINPKSIRKVILGGDDMTIICDANIALDFTNKFLKEFEKQTQKQMGGSGLTACAGIAYCNHKYPFHYAVNLAESLCSYSKTHSKKINKDLAPSSLMFHNIQSSNFTDFNEYIDKELTLNKCADSVYLNYGPYFTSTQNNYATIDSFNNLANALMVKGSPANRLREWLTILGQNKNEAKERLLRINQMMDLKEKMYSKSCLENNLFEFNSEMKLTELTYDRGDKTYTPIGDLDTHLSVVDWSNK